MPVRMTPALKELDIQRTCEDILRWDSWRIFRLEQNFSERKQKVVGEKGAADALCIRYLYPSDIARLTDGTDFAVHMAKTQVVFIEWKRKGGKAGIDQVKWHFAERAKGALTWLAGVDFEPTIEGFRDHYKQSGLQRRK